MEWACMITEAEGTYTPLSASWKGRRACAAALATAWRSENQARRRQHTSSLRAKGRCSSSSRQAEGGFSLHLCVLLRSSMCWMRPTHNARASASLNPPSHLLLLGAIRLQRHCALEGSCPAGCAGARMSALVQPCIPEGEEALTLGSINKVIWPPHKAKTFTVAFIRNSFLKLGSLAMFKPLNSSTESSSGNHAPVI
ncbi:LOW QUALITY PROTEIN: uncharacterized protein LOC100601920 [Nomascus leucogenys]|uniref:LOW QUALITY PROTEIN: uncharacterized protein LOC100601920 n=1 Tax=Nomascus leucogenys TaxID=61853 RepID=UPI00122DBFE2|nr:LOW QUALITY PROTEIN: uncharacterized protein LOC100601920 [Nomascus leucogenys]